MLGLIVQQTNSTVTTTVFQQTSGLSFLGIPLTDWITASMAVAIVVLTVVTFLEGWRTRRIDLIERQLERFYNPVYEIMGNMIRSGNKERDVDVITVSPHDLEILDKLFLTYGHYLSFSPFIDGYLDDAIRNLLRHAREGADRGAYSSDAFRQCRDYVEVTRMGLLGELDQLNSVFWMRKKLKAKWYHLKWRLRQEKRQRRAARKSGDLNERS